MSEYIPKTPTLQIFLDRVTRFSDKYPEEGKILYGSLLEWASSPEIAARVNSLGEAIESQITSCIDEMRKHGRKVSVAKFIEGLFLPNPAGEISADIVMGRFQMG